MILRSLECTLVCDYSLSPITCHVSTHSYKLKPINILGPTRRAQPYMAWYSGSVRGGTTNYLCSAFPERNSAKRVHNRRSVNRDIEGRRTPRSTAHDVVAYPRLGFHRLLARTALQSACCRALAGASHCDRQLGTAVATIRGCHVFWHVWRSRSMGLERLGCRFW